MALKTPIETHCRDCGNPTARIAPPDIWWMPCNCKHTGPECGPVSPPRTLRMDEAMVCFNGDPYDFVGPWLEAKSREQA